MIERAEALERTDVHRLGMLVFIASEALFFAALIAAFLLHRAAWIDRAPRLDLPLTLLFTALLLASSGTLWLAERAARAGQAAAARGWLLVTLALGTIFLGGQAREYATLYAEGVTISSGLFGTTFYTLTGFHGLHVLGGLLALAVLAGLAVNGAGRILGRHAVALETISLYWHFVDAVWIAVFAVVYLGTVLA